MDDPIRRRPTHVRDRDQRGSSRFEGTKGKVKPQSEERGHQGFSCFPRRCGAPGTGHRENGRSDHRTSGRKAARCWPQAPRRALCMALRLMRSNAPTPSTDRVRLGSESVDACKLCARASVPTRVDRANAATCCERASKKKQAQDLGGARWGRATAGLAEVGAEQKRCPVLGPPTLVARPR